MKFASIDIGSNAVRLLLAQVLNNGEPFISKDSLIRIPIRLGEDSFINQVISAEKKEKLISALIGFKYLIESYKPVDFMACATAAMRESQNAQEIIQEIKEKTDIEINIINGRQEAEMICSNQFDKNSLSLSSSLLFIDVGGGSTEMTLFSNNKVIISESFNIGAVRIINNRVSKEQWDTMKAWVKENMRKYKHITAIGSGGNINKLYKFAGEKEKTSLTFGKIKKICKYLSSFSFEERVRILNIHTDRADVIIPASNIFLKIMKWAKIKKIYVPLFGLSDGLIRFLYEKHNKKQEF